GHSLFDSRTGSRALPPLSRVMNPFEMRGPQFLAFYAALTLIVFVIVWFVRRSREFEAGVVAPSAFSDPYLIAYLRGDVNEVVRVAVVSLVDRGLLSASGETLKTTVAGRQTSARKKIEQYVVERCLGGLKMSDLMGGAPPPDVVAEYRTTLEQRRMFPDASITAVRKSLFLAAGGFRVAVSAIKILIGLSRGRPIGNL